MFPLYLLLVVGREVGGADLDRVLDLGDNCLVFRVRFLGEDVADADARLLGGTTLFLGDFLVGDFFLLWLAGDFLEGDFLFRLFGEDEVEGECRLVVEHVGVVGAIAPHTGMRRMNSKLCAKYHEGGQERKSFLKVDTGISRRQ